MKVTVTDRDIQKGATFGGDGGRCPVARAIGRLLSDGKRQPLVTVTPLRVEINQYSLPLPEKARDWIASFDCGLTVYPFSFELPDATAATEV